MSERESREKLEQLNSKIRLTQKDLDSQRQAIEKRKKEKESERLLNIEIQKAQELLKSLEDQKDEVDKELNKE